MGIDGLFGTSVELLGKTLDLRSRNHNLVAGNLANAETPGYTPKTLVFADELRGALKQRKGPDLTNPRHIPLKGQAGELREVQGKVVEKPSATPGRDGNSVELENEMNRMVENQIMFNASVQILAKKFEGLKYAIKEK